MSGKPIKPPFTLDDLPEGSKIYQVGIERALPGGGSRVDRYRVEADGSLTAWHYCSPPHEDTTSIYSPATWKCPECSEIWQLQIRTWYGTTNGDRDNATSYRY
jgi:hypothetical protein